MSNRDSDGSFTIPATPEGREDPGAAPGAEGRGSAEQAHLVQRVTAEEMAGWVRLEHISWETAERLIAAAKQNFVRPSRAERHAADAPEDPATPLDEGNEMTEGVAPSGDGARRARRGTKK